MELKVWVEGIQRVICGVTEATTCQEVVVALAHAIGKTGRFTLIEKWRENERLLAPTDNPLCVLQKWGEYSSDVQFILRHSEKGRRGERSKQKENFSHNFTPHPDVRPHGGNIKKSLTFSGAHTSYLNAAAKHRTKRIAPENSSLESLEEHSSYTSHSSKSSVSPYASLEKKYKQTTLPTQHVSPYNSLEKHRLSPNTHSGLQLPSPLSQSPRSNSSYSSLSPVNGDMQKRTSPSSASQPPGGIPEEYDLEHHLVGSKGDSEIVHLNGGFSEAEFRAKLSSGLDKDTLSKLVQLQREKLTVQESQLKVFESEIQYWTEREEDYERQASLLKEEAERLSHSEQNINSELQELDLVSWGDKLDIEKQNEKTLQSELTLMRSKLSNAESELLQLKNKLHTLSGDLTQENGEQSKADQELKDNEFKVLQEVAELQKQMNQELVEHEQKQGELDEVVDQVKELETAILERKTQIADYERDLKECNLDGFMKAPSDMLKNPMDENPPFNRLSPARPGSGRKMTHSPQLLKETVATAKNPHGLWV